MNITTISTTLSAKQVKDLIRRARTRYAEIDHADWDSNRYRTHDTAKWEQAAKEAAPTEWRDIIRILAKGWRYYGGNEGAR